MAKKKFIFKDSIISETNDYIIVNKPPFISCLDDRNDDINIKDVAREYSDDAQLCHRIDKDTSGVLVIAKNEEAYRNLSIQFEKRKVVKVYHAIVGGLHEVDGIQVDAPISHTSGSSRVKIDFNDGKPSTTIIKTGKLFKRHTLMFCKPLTGRMHQIRVHLAHTGMPIVCDGAYGGQKLFLSELKKNYNLKRDEVERPMISRFALHASSITFNDLGGKEVTFEAEYPKDFRVLVKQLSKHN